MNKESIIPFIFFNRDCPLCKEKSSIIFEDYLYVPYDKISKVIGGTYKVKCSKCNKEYIILWDTKGNPSLGDKNGFIHDFEEQFKNNEKRDLDDILFGEI